MEDGAAGTRTSRHRWLCHDRSRTPTGRLDKAVGHVPREDELSGVQGILGLPHELAFEIVVPQTSAL